MDLKERINAFAELGNFLSKIESKNEFESILASAEAQNGWFTPENIKFSFQSWANALTEKNLQDWTSNYNIEEKNPKTVAVIMAGNIPLVGFHDFLSVLITGNNVLAKLSSNDKILLPLLAKELISIEPNFKNKIEFTDGKLNDFDAVIATGSNNTSKYFEYYFGKYPHIIRKNRNSVAILSGNETKEELELLADDIFQYFGLGCRNVSKIYVPENYDFKLFFEAMFSWKEIINNHKYINNYDYNKAVYLMDSLPLLDNEFMLLKKDSGFSSPISVVFYDEYAAIETLKDELESQSENVQCIVSNLEIDGKVNFGEAQKPKLWEYADGVDTIDFLLKLN
ncbi:acyl-CoA reductase [Aequorivita echinoideorum]|uniref:Acyl-CoA reductase n=1 Tax=Aequorivita echinoideorum TaxID=1549647 RepID=A0ABS5S6W3_9FLAO|nr:acyl-CoA reductase [Aequorivita echinoideorum]MBT0608941.1 acyl-CoA reductase [Aequorivita echinoideorum]